MHPTSLLMMVAAIAAVAAALLLPRVKPAHDRPLHWEINNKQRASSQRANGPRLRYMSFNIRYDGDERKPDNNWSARSRRVANAISTWSPAVVGMQEVLRNQLIDMVTHLAQTAHPYAAVVQNGTLGPEEVAQPSDSIRLHDTALAILFRADLLELLEQAVVRLPITPDAEKTARKIMIARFRLRSNPATVFIVFNTHLHSGSELARRNQSRGLIDTVNQWATKYPEASLVMNGDFNSLPGQFVHAALHAETPLADAWNRAEFRRGSVGISYHGWWGVVGNCFAARLVQGILFTLRGIGFDWGRWMSYPLQIVMPQFSWHSAIPEDVLLLRRLHVDWILTDRTVHVHWITVGEVRNGDFSSDHFPIIADLSFED